MRSSRMGNRKEQKGSFKRVFRRKKVCRYCKDKKLTIDYKDAKALRPFISERGKILSGRITGACARHQREIKMAIKRARDIALLPFLTTYN